MDEGRLERILKSLRRAAVISIFPLVVSCGDFWGDESCEEDYYDDDYDVIVPHESYSIKYSALYDGKVLILDDNHTLEYNYFVPYENFFVIRDVSRKVVFEAIDSWDDFAWAHFKYRVSGGSWRYIDNVDGRGCLDFGLESLVGENVDIAAFIDDYYNDDSVVVNHLYVDKNDAPEYKSYGDFDGYAYFDILHGQEPNMKLPKISDPEGDDKFFFVFMDGYFVGRIDDDYFYTPKKLNCGVYDFTVVPVDEFGEEGFESYPCRVYVR